MATNNFSMENVLAVVVTCNRKELLLEALNALLSQSVQCSILVVDNASSDGTKEALKDYIDQKKILYRYLDTNIGGAGGFNTGIKEGYKLGFEYFWIMDDDSIPTPTALEELENFAISHPDFGFLSSKVLWKDGSLALMNAPKFDEGSQSDDKVHRIHQASFVSCFVNKQAIQKCGLPIADFFIWGDDVEYTRRIARDFPCWYVPKSVVIHKCASNVGSDISKDSSDRLSRYHYAYRNEVYIAKEEGLKRKLYQIAKILLHTGRVLFRAPDQKAKRISIIWSSSKDGLSFNPRKERME